MIIRRAWRKACPSISHTRELSLVAWGTNSTGQCGTSDHSPLLLAPSEVANLQGVPLAHLVASKSHSAAITESGEVWTFGDNSYGQLGHNSTATVYTPHRVEALVGHVSAQNIALGRRHTLITDSSGRLWACGTNEAGELGLPPPGGEDDNIRDVSLYDASSSASTSSSGIRAGSNRLNRQAAAAAALLKSRNTSLSATSNGNGGGEEAAREGQQQRSVAAVAAREEAAAAAVLDAALSQQSTSHHHHHHAEQQASSSGWQMSLVPMIDHSQRSAEMKLLHEMFNDKLHAQSANDNFLSSWNHQAMHSVHTVHSTQVVFPTPIRTSLAAVGFDTEERSSYPSATPGRGGRKITHIAANGKESAVIGSDGSLKVFGGGFMRTFHPEKDRKWVYEAIPPIPPAVHAALSDLGGAKQSVLTAVLNAVLTHSGAVVVWPSTYTHHHKRQQSLQQNNNNNNEFIVLGGGASSSLSVPLMNEELPALPAVFHFITGGFNQILISDGRAVWTITAVDKFHPISSLRVTKTLDLGDDAVRAEGLTAGGLAAAVVGESGRLWMWGSVLPKEAIPSLLAHAESEGHGHWAYSASSTATSDLLLPTTTGSGSGSGGQSEEGWAGLGGRKPQVVPGLHGVKKVALGIGYCIAEVA